jgi:hypothetical protein
VRCSHFISFSTQPSTFAVEAAILACYDFRTNEKKKGKKKKHEKKRGETHKNTKMATQLDLEIQYKLVMKQGKEAQSCWEKKNSAIQSVLERLIVDVDTKGETTKKCV